MDSIGGFHEVQNDDRLSQLVYHHPKYQPIPKTKKPTLFDKAASRDHPSDQPLFLCPLLRILKDNSDSHTYKVSYSPEYVGSTTRSEKSYEDPMLPLSWCNNKEFDADGGCDICSGSNFGTDYYFCVKCDKVFHKECVQSPFKIKHPYHPEHFLQLSYHDFSAPDMKCLCCRRGGKDLVYYCTICDVGMHTVCAMKSIPLGGFHEVENDDGKLSQLVYHHPKYQPIPQTHSPTSDDEAPSHDHTSQPLFLCPYPRCTKKTSNSITYEVSHSLEYVSTRRTDEDHSVLPLFWCNNQVFDVNGGCQICGGSHSGTDYYFCELSSTIYHKECVQSPFIINHPYHPEHSLQLSYREASAPSIECSCCGRRAINLVYSCTTCDAVMHTICAMKSIPFVVDQPKTHDHALTFFPRQASLTCNVCGFLRKNHPTYVCLRCNFVAHKDCMYSPRIIKISRHHHRIYYVSSLQSEELSCGVCRKSIDDDYSAYTCDKCDDYAVHVRCALRQDVWDGVELEDVAEQDDITQDVGPFEIIFEGVILHFLHDHYLQLEVSIIFDENKFCQVCVMPICEGNFYSCMECEFILHETCASSPRRIQHVLHPHPLNLIPMSSKYDKDNFYCDACYRYCGDFMYSCPVEECDFGVDVRCAAISEPFDFQGHEHPLFLALHPNVKPICEVCKSECYKQFNCIKCDFIVCIKCATLPYKARYKHDKHFLKLLWGKEVCEKDWCEVCERNLRDTNTKFFYWCNVCCTTVHTACLFDDDLYLKPGQILDVREGNEVKQVKVLARRNLSRPLCDSCEFPCQGRLFTTDNFTTCSMKCARGII